MNFALQNLYFENEDSIVISIIEKATLFMKFKSLACRDFLGIKNEVFNNRTHLKAAIGWIKQAQDITKDNGVSAGYFQDYGWETSYPETTGYIIPTMFDYSNFANDYDSKKRAIEMSDFLIRTQLETGSFRLGFAGAPHDPEVFDTGQCLQGLVRCYKETKHDEYLSSAVKAGDWLVSVQDNDGAWRKHSFNGIPHTYYTRVAIALLELQKVVGDHKYKEVAVKNIEWALANRNENGWYKNCAFDNESMSHPTTHVIGYTAEGILECGFILNEAKFIKAATTTMDSLLKKYVSDNQTKGTYDENWNSLDNYSCLTGDAQIAMIWLRLYELTNDVKYKDAAVKLNNYLKSTQYVYDRNKGVEGGIKGSHPIYGEYNPYRFLNWAAKFFVDSLLREESLKC